MFAALAVLVQQNAKLVAKLARVETRVQENQVRVQRMSQMYYRLSQLELAPDYPARVGFTLEELRGYREELGETAPQHLHQAIAVLEQGVLKEVVATPARSAGVSRL